MLLVLSVVIVLIALIVWYANKTKIEKGVAMEGSSKAKAEDSCRGQHSTEA